MTKLCKRRLGTFLFTIVLLIAGCQTAPSPETAQKDSMESDEKASLSSPDTENRAILNARQKEIAAISSKDIGEYSAEDMKKLMEATRSDLIIANDLKITGESNSDSDDSWYEPEGSNIAGYYLNLPNGLMVEIPPPPSFSRDDIYAPTEDIPYSLLLILEGDNSFGEFEKGVTIQQVCVTAGVEPEVFREYYRIAEEAGKQEPDCYILDYPFGDLLMNLKFPKWSEYELSEISFYNRKPDDLWENPESSIEVKAEFVSYGNGYKGLGNPRFNFWITIPDEWNAYSRAANGDGYYLTCDDPDVDMRVYGYNYLPEIEDVSEGEPFIFDSEVQGVCIRKQNTMSWKYLSDDKRMICFYIDYSKNPMWFREHESEVLKAAYSLRDGVTSEQDDLRARIICLQKQFPMDFDEIIGANLKAYLEYALDEAKLDEVYNFLTAKDDPERQKICEYLFYALPGDPLLDYTTLKISNGEIPNELLVLAGLHSMNKTEANVFDEWIKELGGIPVNNPNIWLGTHVEMAAKMIFGDQCTVEHVGYGNKRYAYDSELHVYTHFPGGVSMIDLLIPVVAYQDNGDTYSVEVALIRTGFYSNVGEELAIPNGDTYEYFGYDRLVEMATQRAPRANIILKKTESTEYGLILQSYKYIG